MNAIEPERNCKKITITRGILNVLARQYGAIGALLEGIVVHIPDVKAGAEYTFIARSAKDAWGTEGGRAEGVYP